MKKYKFIGETTMLVNKDNNFLDKTQNQNNLPAMPTIDLDQMNLQQMFSSVQEFANEGEAFIFKGRQIKRFEMGVRRQELLIDQIRNLGVAAEVLARTQASLFMSTALRDALIAESEREIRFAVLAFETRVKNEMDNQKAIEDGAEARRIELDRRRAEVEMFKLRETAEVNSINARTEGEKAKANIINEVFKHLNFENLPPALQTYIISSVFNPSGNQFHDF